ncbi:hypothetical protein CCACVL1_22519 [Corchorus capsularis]|uniref:Uncharacterized protein n=1 Tax=Corchorus capsularis TaxID=210143 RepID=A0A1R3GY31_COCAP|nr:hypothetical protein CCACVL1_22519 [Corchorus capsularis]
MGIPMTQGTRKSKRLKIELGAL